MLSIYTLFPIEWERVLDRAPVITLPPASIAQKIQWTLLQSILLQTTVMLYSSMVTSFPQGKPMGTRYILWLQVLVHCFIHAICDCPVFVVLPHLMCYKMLALISLLGDPPFERIGVDNFLPML